MAVFLKIILPIDRNSVSKAFSYFCEILYYSNGKSNRAKATYPKKNDRNERKPFFKFSEISDNNAKTYSKYN